MKMLKTLRLDLSDTFIFPKTSENEWAVSGAFMFWETDFETLNGKERQAFRAGFVGVNSLGFSTLVEVVEGEKGEAIAALAQNILTHFNAPSLEAALDAATQEIEAACALADLPLGTLLAMHRTYEEGEIREVFRTLTPRAGANGDSLHANANAFTFHEIEEEVDLTALMDKKNG
jgi:Family of unknown function (DUF6505)